MVGNFECEFEGRKHRLTYSKVSVELRSLDIPAKISTLPITEFDIHYYKTGGKAIFLFNPKEHSNLRRFELVLDELDGVRFRAETPNYFDVHFIMYSNPTSFSDIDSFKEPDVDLKLCIYPSKEETNIVVRHKKGVYCYNPQRVFYWDKSKFTLEKVDQKEVLTLESRGDSKCVLRLWGKPSNFYALPVLIKLIKQKNKLVDQTRQQTVAPASFYSPLNSSPHAESPPHTGSPHTGSPNTGSSLWNSSTPIRSGNKRGAVDSPIALRQKPRLILQGDVNKIDHSLPRFPKLDSENTQAKQENRPEEEHAKESQPEVDLASEENIDLTDAEPTKESETRGESQNAADAHSAKAEPATDVVDMANDAEDEPLSRSARRRRARKKIEEEEIVVEPTEDDYEVLIAENFNPISYKFWDGKYTDVAIEDIARLNPQVWVNDTIIWFFLRIFVEKLVREEPEKANEILILDPFFYTSLRSGTTPSWIHKVPLTTKDCLIMPINDTFHWLVAIIVGLNKALDNDDNNGDSNADAINEEQPKPTIIILDSLGSPVRGFGRKVVTALNNALKALGRTPLNLKRFKILKGEVPNQSNSTDCGVFLIHFMEQFLANPTPVYESVEKSTGPNLELDTEYWKPSEAWKKRIELKSKLKELGRAFPKPQVEPSEMNDGSLDDLEVLEVESISRKKSKSKLSNQAVKVEGVKYNSNSDDIIDKGNSKDIQENDTRPEKDSSDHPQGSRKHDEVDGEEHHQGTPATHDTEPIKRDGENDEFMDVEVNEDKPVESVTLDQKQSHQLDDSAPEDIMEKKPVDAEEASVKDVDAEEKGGTDTESSCVEGTVTKDESAKDERSESEKADSHEDDSGGNDSDGNDSDGNEGEGEDNEGKEKGKESGEGENEAQE